MTTLVLADSRALPRPLSLRTEIINQGINPEHLEVGISKGADMLTAYSKAQPLLLILEPKLLVVTTGICNITMRQDRITTLRHPSVQSSSQQL